MSYLIRYTLVCESRRVLEPAQRSACHLRLTGNHNLSRSLGEARREARGFGWKRVTVEGLHRYHKTTTLDLCPICAATYRMKRRLAKKAARQ